MRAIDAVHGPIRAVHGSLGCAVACLVLLGCGSAPDPAPTVATAEPIRGAFTLTREGHAVPVRTALRVEQTAEASTGEDGRGALRLDTGAWVLLDRSAAATVELGKLTLTRGRAWIDCANADETSVVTPHGTLTAQGAAFAVQLGEDGTRVYVGNGEVTYVAPGGSDRVVQGETLKLPASGAPATEPEALWDDWTGGLADPGPRLASASAPVGVLSGRRLDEKGLARTPLPVRSHDVRAVLRGDLARTEVVQTFFNARSDTVEGEWRVRLPSGATIESFAVDTGTGFVDAHVGSFAMQGTTELAWISPEGGQSSLAYDGPSRYRARVWPVSPGASVRVKLVYSEWLERRGAMRTYTVPMRGDGDGPMLGELTIEVDTAGANAGPLRAGMGARVEGQKVVLRRSDVQPRADFHLDLIDREPRPADVARAYVIGAPSESGAEGTERYVLFDVPTESPAADAAQPPLDLVLVVDTSGAIEPENLELARAVVEATLRQLAPTDRVTLRLADLSTHLPEGAPAEVVASTPEVAEQILGAIARAELGGASDLGRALREAALLVAGKPRGAVLYLGDGLPTTGAIDATSLRAELGAIESPPRFFALGIGDGANVDLLRGLFGSQALAVRERTEAARAVMGVLAEAARPSLRGVHFDLGPSVERVVPAQGLTVDEGTSLRLVGRLVDTLPAALTLTGTRDGEAFERILRVEEASVDDGGDVRRRWAVARLAELLDADAGREAIVDLGVRFGVVTPWTSMLVGQAVGIQQGPVLGFDHDPREIAWAVGGGGAQVVAESLGSSEQIGWRRRDRASGGEARTLAEATWPERVSAAPLGLPAATPATGDGGLANAAVTRTLRTNLRGPQGCYERKLLVRPDLSGTVQVQVDVSGTGAVTGVALLYGYGALDDADVTNCILEEVQGMRFPATGATTVLRVTHVYRFDMPTREIGTRRRCSDASTQPLEVRDGLWRERLEANAGVVGALSVWREALGNCELRGWRDRRTLLDRMLRHVGSVRMQVALFQAFGADASVAAYLRRVILRNVRTPDDVVAVREGLGLELPLDWSVFSRQWNAVLDPAARLRLVRRWLEVAPDELDLRLRLLSLLEQTGALDEAKREARALRAEPLADARVRTQVGEFWLRQQDEVEARRVFSELVEYAPLDPWARQRLGDLYRAHAWPDDAYREYQMLARLRPEDGGVLLRIAAAAADAGRIDEALRLEQRLGESADDDDTGPSELARLWTQVRLARLLRAADPALAPQLAERRRSTGALRDPPAIFVALTWSHPDDRPELRVSYPSSPIDAGDSQPSFERAPILGDEQGIEAARIREREEGDYRFELRRTERDAIRDLEAELLVVIAPGTPEERILIEPVRLTRDDRLHRYRLGADGVLAVIPVPPPTPPRAVPAR